jgi:hypothetical protein
MQKVFIEALVGILLGMMLAPFVSRLSGGAV